jgi:4-aminobutyrate aminotransferase/(S)-3-amino-2-methylpropionate transaminase
VSAGKPRIVTQIPGPKSKTLWAEREKYVPRGVSNSTKIFAQSASGALVRDVDGNVFLDFAAGIGVVNAGHCPAEVVEAVKAQAERFLHTSVNVLWYEAYTELAKKLCETAPIKNAKAMFVNSGAECIENAVKIARKHTGRAGVAAVEGSFHGRTLLAMSLTTKAKPYKDGFGPFAQDVYNIPCPNLYRKPEGMDAAAFALSCADRFEEMLSTSLTPEMVACVVVEPVQGEGGFVPMPKPYVKRLREICDRHGILLILDEIQSGIARTGTFYAAEQLGVEPDILTSSKSLAAGLPLGAVIGRAEIMDAPQVGGIGGTFSGSPVACAAALAVIENVRKHGLCGRAREIGGYITARARGMMEKYPQIGDVRGMGAMIGMEFVSDPAEKTPDAAAVNRVIAAALQRGVIFLDAGLHGNVVRFLPPLVMTPEQTELGMDVLDAAIAESV